MRYLTDRKRAEGMGAAGSGTEHHWKMTKSSIALLILIPFFVFMIVPMLGEPYAEVVAYLGRPFPALVAALTIVVSMMHFKDGAQALIEDYVHGMAQKISIILMTCMAYGIAATGVFAIARLAL